MVELIPRKQTSGQGIQVVFWTIDTADNVEISQSQITTSIAVT